MDRKLTNHPSRSEPMEQTDADNPAFAPISVRIHTAVKMTGIGRSKLYELIQAGEIEVIKIGTATLIPVASLHSLLARNRR